MLYHGVSVLPSGAAAGAQSGLHPGDGSVPQSQGLGGQDPASTGAAGLTGTGSVPQCSQFPPEGHDSFVFQEERPPFDIHDYGGRIVRNLSSVGCRRSFASIVRGLDNFEACKYLLASLQLANDFTVEIDSAAGLEDSLDTMSLTLLSTHRATDRFKTLTTSS
ncbi:hypothetical protein GOODEAATRI_030066 [Goodea atripinnis]|uniref:Condensin-2 complex subunit H2 n=1 Tax=Goodea atripinnis TaxID=208336 RepID=A0ABV0N5H8_9TELE